MFAGTHWQPNFIKRIHEVKGTSTRPLKVVTDCGVALVKYIGNPAGEEALISELIGGELANLVGLETPSFAIAPIALLVIFDTWIRNKDRFCVEYDGQYENSNFDNILFVPDKRKTKLLIIDHTHAFAESGLDYELDDGWAEEQEIFGLFDQFKPFLNRNDIQSALDAISRIDAEAIQSICQAVPKEWEFTSSLARRLTECLIARGRNMQRWVMNSLHDQSELNFDGKEG